RRHHHPGRTVGAGGLYRPGCADPVPRGAAPADLGPGRPPLLCSGRWPLIRVFVNERPVSVTPGASVRDAVEVLDRELADLVGRGVAYVTDGVGRPVDAVGHADGGGTRADRVRVRAGCRGGRAALRGSALLPAAAPPRAHPDAGDRGAAGRDQTG